MKKVESDLSDLDIAKTIAMRLECAKCGHTATYTLERVYIDSELRERSPEDPAEYVSFGDYFRCRKCKSAWPWRFTPRAHLALTALMMGRFAGAEDDRLIFARPRIYDGTPFRSAAQAEEYLLSILDREPNNAYVWSRLGNVYRRVGMLPKASKAYKKALEIDSTDIESHYGLGEALFDQDRDEQAVEHYNQVIVLSRENTRLPEAELRNYVRGSIWTLAEIASRNDEDMEVIPSIQTSGESSHAPKSMRLERFNLQKEEDMERLVDLAMGRPDRPTSRFSAGRKPGRNEPCP